MSAERKFWINDPDGKLEWVALSSPLDLIKDMPRKTPKTWRGMPSADKLLKEWEDVADFLNRRCKLTVLPVASNHRYDGMFARDFGTVILDRLYLAASDAPSRRTEQLAVMTALMMQGIEYEYIPSNLTSEGADFIPIGGRTWAAGIGGRTCERAVRHLRRASGVEIRTCRKAPDKIPQHLLGGNRIVGGWLYHMPGAEHVPGFDDQTIEVPYESEVRDKLSMNWLTLGPAEVLMCDDAPQTKALLESRGIVAHTLSMREIRKMAGGFACLTLPLRRSS
tara:strand:- start:2773 stop:3609 length:837 start_codon:yes stop_codon:yes gene_type:complete